MATIQPVQLTLRDAKQTAVGPSLQVAFASSALTAVDEHFGSATRFAIYRVSAAGSDLINLARFDTVGARRQRIEAPRQDRRAARLLRGLLPGGRRLGRPSVDRGRHPAAQGRSTRHDRRDPHLPPRRDRAGHHALGRQGPPARPAGRRPRPLRRDGGGRLGRMNESWREITRKLTLTLTWRIER